MRRYETMMIFPDTLDEDAAKAEFERIKGIVEDQQGELVDEAWWGKRQFAYEINHQNYGWYAVLDFESTLEGKQEIERLLKLSDDVLRFKTVRPQIRVRKPA